MAQQNTRARQQQRQRMMMILVFLLVAGGALFYFLSSKPEAAKKVKAPPPKGAVAIPVARDDIPLGKRISNNMIMMTYRSPREVPADALLSRDEFVGRYTTKPVLAGQYFQQEDVGADGAVGGFSAMATHGKRLIVINANLFPGSIETLKVGDHVDLLAFQGFKASAAGNNKPKRNSGALDGAQPGQPARKNTATNNKTSGSQLVDPVSPASATLIAENAEVMSVPSRKRAARRGGGGGFIVFQMSPQDAHVTSLMIASDVMLRTVFRPFGDNTRLTPDKPLAITTRLPKAVLDPELIQVIANGKTYVTKPNSKIFLSQEEAEEALQPKDMPNMLYGKPVSGNDKSAPTKTTDSMTKDEELVDPAEIEESVKQSAKTRKSASVAQDQISEEDNAEEVY